MTRPTRGDTETIATLRAGLADLIRRATEHSTGHAAADTHISDFADALMDDCRHLDRADRSVKIATMFPAPAAGRVFDVGDVP